MQRFLRNLSLRTDGRLTTDACAMTVALLTKSSRAKNRSEVTFNKTSDSNFVKAKKKNILDVLKMRVEFSFENFQPYGVILKKC